MFGEGGLPEDPYEALAIWLREAEETEINDPTAMAVASVDEDGLPDVRMVLLKGYDERGLVFYTNFQSRKGEEILGQRKAALCMHWKSRRRQFRARGSVEVVTEAEADAYFEGRPHGSRIGAWASDQSRPLESRSVLEERVADVEARFGEAVPRPPHWSGFRIMPTEIEFWQDGEFRLHDRFRFTRPPGGAGWDIQRLYP
ncbi:pyridoxamine 5'-phosphate oxidase [Aureimonas sp. ME7]|uniref:pyridoxamine 5'-phosphate oxidase n=1 Tax=Aureimonas sp. ME7 TaxID=2744252 RepID=UPI001FCEE6C9|nr:pyridoxamine 5'-phosphate oxidase [Aureimonas sp. ME7]